MTYHPGETNLRMAGLVIVNKVDTALEESVSMVESNIRLANPKAAVLRAESPVSLEDPSAVRGKRVLVVEDGPTLTHGEMAFGAGHVAARQAGARKIVDPRPYAVGSILKTFEKYRHIKEILPAMGYGERQMAELKQTINATPCDAVIIGTPIDLSRMLKFNKHSVRVRYELKELQPEVLRSKVEAAAGGAKPPRRASQPVRC
jgi:predicted GTPase